jgi:FMN phosphatase YigB (HAD superfamily)
MLEKFGLTPAQALHFGDELYATGNDRTARESCCTVWVDNEDEMPFYMKMLMHLLRHRVCCRLLDETSDSVNQRAANGVC